MVQASKGEEDSGADEHVGKCRARTHNNDNLPAGTLHRALSGLIFMFYILPSVTLPALCFFRTRITVTLVTITY